LAARASQSDFSAICNLYNKKSTINITYALVSDTSTYYICYIGNGNSTNGATLFIISKGEDLKPQIHLPDG